MIKKLQYILASKEFIVHILSWMCLSIFPISLALIELGEIPGDMYYRILAAPVLFYINFFFLVPKFLLRKKVFRYIIYSLGTLLLFNYLIISVLPHSSLDKIQQMIDANSQIPFVRGLKIALPVIFSFSIFLLGGIFSLVVNYFKEVQISNQREASQKEMELAFLRTQLNPHFLFNSLNSIYSLVRSKSNKAPDAIITLSELMRYMLFQGNGNKVSLAQELDYIKNYILLQKLRLKDNSNLNINIEGDCKDLFIPPFLLISFIENAFKYGTDYKGNTHIDLDIKINNYTLEFRLRNIIGINKSKSENTGIGLVNIKNQLNNLYGGDYKLSIWQDKGYYNVELNIILK